MEEGEVCGGDALADPVPPPSRAATPPTRKSSEGKEGTALGVRRRGIQGDVEGVTTSPVKPPPAKRGFIVVQGDTDRIKAEAILFSKEATSLQMAESTNFWAEKCESAPDKATAHCYRTLQEENIKVLEASKRKGLMELIQFTREKDGSFKLTFPDS